MPVLERGGDRDGAGRGRRAVPLKRLPRHRRSVVTAITPPARPRATIHGIASTILNPQPDPPSWGLHVPPCTASTSTPTATASSAPIPSKTTMTMRTGLSVSVSRSQAADGHGTAGRRISRALCATAQEERETGRFYCVRRYQICLERPERRAADVVRLPFVQKRRRRLLDSSQPRAAPTANTTATTTVLMRTGGHHGSTLGSQL
jgi:hypothetical protein